MAITFNMILSKAGFKPEDVRLLRHKDNRAAKGRTPYELWLSDRAKFDEYQERQDIKNHGKLNARYWASFVVTPSGDTIFAGIYQVTDPRLLEKDLPMPQRDGVDKAGSCNHYTLNAQDKLNDLIGKLVIDWGDGKIAWIQRADRQDKNIIELRKTVVKEKFPGFMKLIWPLSELKRFPESWIDALRSAKGVYLLTGRKQGEYYVGKATSDSGFWQRWNEHAQTGCGDGVAFEKQESSSSDYQVSILEVAGTAAEEDDISAMEMRWMAKLRSREIGLNPNGPLG